MLNVKALAALGTLAVVIFGSFATGAAIVKMTRQPAAAVEQERARGGEFPEQRAPTDNAEGMPAAASVDSVNDTLFDNGTVPQDAGAPPQSDGAQDGVRDDFIGQDAGWYDGGSGRLYGGERGGWEGEGREREYREHGEYGEGEDERHEYRERRERESLPYEGGGRGY